jgi:hypothetical protein
MLSNHLSQAARERTCLKVDSYVNNFPRTVSFKLGAKLAEKYVMILCFIFCFMWLAIIVEPKQWNRRQKFNNITLSYVFTVQWCEL